MKVLNISTKCIGCGQCVMECPKYVRELSNGNAEAIPSVPIEDSELEKIIKLIERCPVGAITFVEEERKSVREIKEELKKYIDSFTVKKVTKDDFSLEYIKDEYLPVMNSFGGDGGLFMKFSSKSSAKSAAEAAFKRECYSKAAYTAMIYSLLSKFKSEYLRKYYCCDDEQGNVYFEYNEAVRKYLEKVCLELKECNVKVPENLEKFNVYLGKRDGVISVLCEFENITSISSGIMENFFDRDECSKLSWYLDYIDYDSVEDYVGEGWFGRSKFKTKWGYKNFNVATTQFVDDLKWAIDITKNDIIRHVTQLVNDALNHFERQVKDELKKKMELIP